MATSERDEALEAGAAVGADEQRLHELGYRQELSRAWSGFTNFAISFTIISVLAGTFTTFAFAWLSSWWSTASTSPTRRPVCRGTTGST